MLDVGSMLVVGVQMTVCMTELIPFLMLSLGCPDSDPILPIQNPERKNALKWMCGHYFLSSQHAVKMGKSSHHLSDFLTFFRDFFHLYPPFFISES